MPPADRSPSSRSPGPARGGGEPGRTAQDPNAYSAGLWKVSGLGMTMLSEVLGGALIGFCLDYLFKTTPVLLVVFSLLGLVVALTGFIRAALGVSGQAGRDARDAVAAGRATALPEEPEDDAPPDAAELTGAHPTAELEAELRAELESLAATLQDEADAARGDEDVDPDDRPSAAPGQAGKTGEVGDADDAPPPARDRDDRDDRDRRPRDP